MDWCLGREVLWMPAILAIPKQVVVVIVRRNPMSQKGRSKHQKLVFDVFGWIGWIHGIWNHVCFLRFWNQLMFVRRQDVEGILRSEIHQTGGPEPHNPTYTCRVYHRPRFRRQAWSPPALKKHSKQQQVSHRWVDHGHVWKPVFLCIQLETRVVDRDEKEWTNALFGFHIIRLSIVIPLAHRFTWNQNLIVLVDNAIYRALFCNMSRNWTLRQ